MCVFWFLFVLLYFCLSYKLTKKLVNKNIGIKKKLKLEFQKKSYEHKINIELLTTERTHISWLWILLINTEIIFSVNLWCMKHKMHCINFFGCIWTIDTFLQFLFQFFLFFFKRSSLHNLNNFRVFFVATWIDFWKKNLVFFIKTGYNKKLRYFKFVPFFWIKKNYAKIQNLRKNTTFMRKYKIYGKKKKKTTKSIKYNASMTFKQNFWIFSFLEMQTLILLKF